MEKIKLFNRDGANLWLEKLSDLEDKISRWKLKVDKKHEYCLQFMRIIGNDPNHIEAVDPSGGPFISIGDKLENGKYTIVTIINSLIFDLSERH